MAKYFLIYHINNGILAHTLRFNRISAIKINKFRHLVHHHVYYHFLCWWWPLTQEIWNIPIIRQLDAYKVINKRPGKRPPPFSKKSRPKCPLALWRQTTVLLYFTGLSSGHLFLDRGLKVGDVFFTKSGGGEGWLGMNPIFGIDPAV